MGKQEMHTQFWLEDLMVNKSLEKPRVDDGMILKICYWEQVSKI
jgi:hypothetical protein